MENTNTQGVHVHVHRDVCALPFNYKQSVLACFRYCVLTLSDLLQKT